jgi:dTDP-4-amino-4,6-dideoxygalactose transaminase
MIQCDQRDELKTYLKECKISSAIHYPKPIHLQAAACHLGYKLGDFPETERQSQRILSLPVHHMLSTEQVEFVALKVKEFYR